MWGQRPHFKQMTRRQAPCSGAKRGPTRRGRVHSQEGAADQARGGNWLQARQPRVAGAPKARLAAKEETRQAAQSLLASVNTPGPREALERRVRGVPAVRTSID